MDGRGVDPRAGRIHVETRHTPLVEIRQCGPDTITQGGHPPLVHQTRRIRTHGTILEIPETKHLAIRHIVIFDEHHCLWFPNGRRHTQRTDVAAKIVRGMSHAVVPDRCTEPKREVRRGRRVRIGDRADEMPIQVALQVAGMRRLIRLGEDHRDMSPDALQGSRVHLRLADGLDASRLSRQIGETHTHRVALTEDRRHVIAIGLETERNSPGVVGVVVQTREELDREGRVTREFRGKPGDVHIPPHSRPVHKCEMQRLRMNAENL